MNCQQFDQIVVDLGRDCIADVAVQDGVLDHAQSCTRCAAQLSDQRMLTVALRAVSAATGKAQAPERVEHGLLGEYRTRFDVSRPATPGRSSSRPVARRSPTLQSPLRPPEPSGAGGSGDGALWAAGRTAPAVWRVWAVAAAAILLLALVVAWKLRPTSHVRPVELASSQQGTHREAEKAAAAREGETGPAPAVVPHAASRARPTVKHGAPYKRVATPEQTAATEATTRFYPLPYSSGLGLDEGWALVRVQVRRSSLAALGVPVSAGSATGEILTADVVVGQDGLARGIRFVQ